MCKKISSLGFALLFSQLLTGQVSVTTYHNDNLRTGLNASETTLTPASVSGGNFGKLFSLSVTGQVYAQPLYLSNVTITTGANAGVHNVVFIATEANYLYAFDADTGDSLWTVGPSLLGNPVNCNTIPGYGSYQDLYPQIGITSTPVIATDINAIFVVAASSPGVTGQAQRFKLHSIDIATGHERVNSPMEITGSVPGTGDTAHSDSSDGTTLTFSPQQHHQRPALLLAGGLVYVTFGSHQDLTPYHGWVFAYDHLSLKRFGIKCTTPDGGDGAIWQSGVGPLADSAGYVYAVTGNGDNNAGSSSLSSAYISADRRNYGMSMMRLNPKAGLKTAGFYTPSDFIAESGYDGDLGSGGPMMIPGTNYILFATKNYDMFMVDTTALPGVDYGYAYVHQRLYAGGPVFGPMSFFNNNIYVWPSNTVLTYFTYYPMAGYLGTTPTYQKVCTSSDCSTTTTATTTGFTHSFRMSPPTSISANGTSDGIVWATASTNGQSLDDSSHGVLLAFDATTLVPLFSSDADSSNTASSWAKWVPPTIANGKVYVATFSGQVLVYGMKQ